MNSDDKHLLALTIMVIVFVLLVFGTMHAGSRDAARVEIECIRARGEMVNGACMFRGGR